MQGLERLRGKSPPEPADVPESNAPDPGDGDALRAIVFEATQQLRDAIRLEAHEIGELLRAERESLEEAIESLHELIAEARETGVTEEDDVEGTGHAPPPEGVMVDLNEAGHADLCAAGMSETQASRVIRHRDFWGSFDAVSELEHVPGFSPEHRAELERHLSVGTDEELAEDGI